MISFFQLSCTKQNHFTQLWILLKGKNSFNTPIFPGVYAVLGAASMLAGTGRIAVALMQ